LLHRAQCLFLLCALCIRLMTLLRNRVVDGAMGILGIQRVGYQRVIENTIIAATAAAAVVFIFRRRTYTNQKKNVQALAVSQAM